jgi:protocatechuate 3,4-dioxygenase beta subunit
VTACVVAVWHRGLLWDGTTPLLVATPPTTAGPFTPSSLERTATSPGWPGGSRAKGQIIHVAGRVLNQRGGPVPGARIEVWQANTFGRYDHPSDANPAPLDPGFQGYAVQLTDREGRFRFTTIKPGPYAGEGGRIRTPHIHFDVSGHVDRRITQLFFAGEPLNDQDRILREVPRNRERLIADLLPPPPDEDATSRLVQWDIVLPRG